MNLNIRKYKGDKKKLRWQIVVYNRISNHKKGTKCHQRAILSESNCSWQCDEFSS